MTDAPATIDPAETLTVTLDGWEGPLDLLLRLARTQRVDLQSISILALVDQYLAFVAATRASRLELAADYLVMAAWLAHLKSALLLPRVPGDVEDPDEQASRLTVRLARLDAMREAGEALMARDRIGRDVFARGAPEGLRTVHRPVWRADLYDLIAAYARVSARSRPVMQVVARRQVMTLEAAIARVSMLVGAAIDWSMLQDLVPDTGDAAFRRSALASSFVAALELARQGRVELRQAAGDALYLRAVR